MIKKIALGLLLLSFCVTSCKKEYITQNFVEESDNNYENWELVLNQTNKQIDSWKNPDILSTIDFYYTLENEFVGVIEGFNWDVYWGKEKRSVYIDLDTNLLLPQRKEYILNVPHSAPYLKEMYSKEIYFDEFQIIHVSLSDLMFYSTALERVFKYTR